MKTIQVTVMAGERTCDEGDIFFWSDDTVIRSGMITTSDIWSVRIELHRQLDQCLDQIMAEIEHGQQK